MDLDEPAPGTAPIPWDGDGSKTECLTDPRDAEITKLKQQRGVLLNTTADACIARDRYKRLCAAACEFLRSPALHTLRVGDRRFSRDELIAYLLDMDVGPT